MTICDRPIVHHLLDRIAACRHIDDAKNIVVCTTTDSSDDELEEVVTEYGASVFRGDRDDILKRFGDAMAHFEFDAVVQADGDDPLSATEYMDLTMDRLLESDDIDIVTVAGVPLGTATKSFSRAAIEKVLASYLTTENDTGFIDFFTKTGVCEHVELAPTGEHHIHTTARLTLDYEEDLQFFTAVFEALYQPGEVFDLAAVVTLLNGQPQLVEINQAVDEEYWQRWHSKRSLKFKDRDGNVRDIDG